MMQQQKIFINSSFNGQQGLQQQTRGVLSALSVNTMNNSKAMNNNKSLSKLQEADLKQRTLHLIYQQVNEALGDSVSSNSSSSGEQQQSQAATRYKTELCRSFQENGICKYGEKCQFAHGTHELRNMMRHPKYKTELCRTFHAAGYCPYGPRCHFVHDTSAEANQSRQNQSPKSNSLKIVSSSSSKPSSNSNSPHQANFFDESNNDGHFNGTQQYGNNLLMCAARVDSFESNKYSSTSSSRKESTSSSISTCSSSDISPRSSSPDSLQGHFTKSCSLLDETSATLAESTLLVNQILNNINSASSFDQLNAIQFLSLAAVLSAANNHNH